MLQQGQASDPSAFGAQCELLRAFLALRAAIVDRVEQVLNCQKKALEYQQDYALLSRQFLDCFFALPTIDSTQAALRDALEQAHWASGFKPRAQAGNDIVDPVEQMLRVFHLWRQTHWPGQKGRARFAHTLFNLYCLRRLSLLCLRLWDADHDGAAVRLAQLQALLDALWNGTPADQPRLVRDVRWLFPVAMSPTTDSLAGYFVVAQQIAASFGADDRIEVQKAWVQTGAGHLRSQLHDLTRRRGVALDDRELVLLTRMSNALDVALLMEGLVTLLAAYEQCLQGDASHERQHLAAAICQGLSPDPELFVNRLDLLGPYTMIEQVFVTSDAAGQAVYTEAGQRHRALLAQYTAAIARLAPHLYDDCRQNAVPDEAYSPYGLLYGFASNLLELSAFKAVQIDAPTQFSLEDAFSKGGADKRAWVNGWRDLPHIRPDIVKQFEYPASFAGTIQARVEHALQQCVTGSAGTQPCGRLFLVPEDAAQPTAEPVELPALPARYIVSSDPQLVAAAQATAKDQDDLLHCRDEGEFLVSYPTAAGWVGLTKDLLTDFCGTGHDARLVLPRAAAALLAAMAPELVVLP